MIAIMKYGLIIICCFLVTSCAWNIRSDFETQMKDYNKRFRWDDMAGAGMAYLLPEERDSFMQAISDLKTRGVTITDYRLLTSECLPEQGTAEAITEFDYYELPSNRIKTIQYKQQWVYKEINNKKSWKLKNSIPTFE